jgi:hypothetical protein
LESSPVIVSDPGTLERTTMASFTLIGLVLGMTNANMKLVVLNVPLEDQMETPDAKLDAGEFIVKRVVELAKLYDELKGIASSFVIDCANAAS